MRADGCGERSARLPLSGSEACQHFTCVVDLTVGPLLSPMGSACTKTLDTEQSHKYSVEKEIDDALGKRIF